MHTICTSVKLSVRRRAPGLLRRRNTIGNRVKRGLQRAGRGPGLDACQAVLLRHILRFAAVLRRRRRVAGLPTQGDEGASDGHLKQLDPRRR
jgi:hypothetical protein